MEEPVAGVAPAPHTAPDKLSPLKVRDLHHLAQFLCPSGELDAPARPPADSEELVQATAAECAEMKGRGGHYHKLDEATVAEAVATSEQPPAEEAADHAANGVPKGPTCAACVRLQDFFDVPCASRRATRRRRRFRREKRGRNRVMWFII